MTDDPARAGMTPEELANKLDTDYDIQYVGPGHVDLEVERAYGLEIEAALRRLAVYEREGPWLRKEAAALERENARLRKTIEQLRAMTVFHDEPDEVLEVGDG